MTRLRHALPVIAILAVLACGEAPEPDTEIEQPTAETPEPAAVPAWVTEVAAVATAIEAQPAAADSILGAHEMTPAGLDSLLYEIAADPTLTAAYRAARGN